MKFEKSRYSKCVSDNHQEKKNNQNRFDTQNEINKNIPQFEM